MGARCFLDHVSLSYCWVTHHPKTWWLQRRRRSLLPEFVCELGICFRLCLARAPQRSQLCSTCVCLTSSSLDQPILPFSYERAETHNTRGLLRCRLAHHHLSLILLTHRDVMTCLGQNEKTLQWLGKECGYEERQQTRLWVQLLPEHEWDGRTETQKSPWLAGAARASRGPARPRGPWVGWLKAAWSKLGLSLDPITFSLCPERAWERCPGP